MNASEKAFSGSFASLSSAGYRISRLARAGLDLYFDTRLNLRAMGLTYVSLLSLVPFLAVSFSLLKSFGAQYELRPLLTEALAALGPGREEVTQRLIRYVNNINVEVLGGVGIAGLFYTVVSLVGSVEDSLNAVWNAPRARSWVNRYKGYLSVILVGPVLVFAALAFAASAENYFVFEKVFGYQYIELFAALITQWMPLLFLCAGFTLIYRFVPCTYVPFTSAAVGGAMAGISWQLAGKVFTAFVAGSSRYSALYSGFAILAVFLLWFYTAWLIILLGAVIAYLHQNARFYIRHGASATRAADFRERLAVAILWEIGSRFYAGRPPWQEFALGRQLGVPGSEVTSVVDRLIEAGYLVRSSEPEGVTLARSPESIRITALLRLLRGEAGDDARVCEPQGAAAFFRRRDEAMEGALGGLTLRSVVLEGAPRGGVAAAAEPRHGEASR